MAKQQMTPKSKVPPASRARARKAAPAAGSKSARTARSYVPGAKNPPRKKPDPFKIVRAQAAEAALWLPPASLKPWDRNPRDNAASVARVRDSIARFGFGAPVVARAADREIIAGHTRVLAALELGMKQIPVRLLDISAKDAHTLALADNRLSELTPWTSELQAILADMELPDVQLAGWTEQELQTLLAMPELPGDGSDLADPDEDGERTGQATFGVYPWEAIAEAHVEELVHDKREMAEYFALSTADVMVELNRCAAGGKARVSLTDRWFPHRYDVQCGKAPATPNESLRDPEVIRGACQWLAEVKGWPSRTYLLRTLMLFHGRMAARQFPPHVARDIYRKYSQPGAAVLDPCAGWGGRLLGWHCSGHGGSYHGIDAGMDTWRGFERMLGDLNIEGARIQHGAFEDVRLEPEAYDFAFTSPPYFTVELYGDDPTQSTVRYTDYASWRSGFLVPLVRNTLAALRPGAAFVLNVSDAGQYVIAQDVQAIARECGARVELAEKIDIGAGSTGGLAKATAMVEDLIVLRKEK